MHSKIFLNKFSFMNFESFKKSPNFIKLGMTEEDQKKLYEQNLNGQALFNIDYMGKDSFMIKDEWRWLIDFCEGTSNLFRNIFYGNNIEEYDQKFDEHLSTCAYLSYASNYATMKRYTFQLYLHEKLPKESSEFFKNYTIECTIREKDKINHNYSVSYLYLDKRIFFNIYYKSLNISIDQILILKPEFQLEIKLVFKSNGQ